MKDKIKQSNIFGANMIYSTKKYITKQRTQGFIAGVLASIIASIIYDLIKTYL